MATEAVRARSTTSLWRWTPSRPAAPGCCAGGHLALWAAARGRLPAVLAPAPVTDLGRVIREGHSNGAALELLGGPDHAEFRTALTLLRDRDSTGVPMTVPHGAAAEEAPLEQFCDHWAVRPEEELVILSEAGHHTLVEPGAQTSTR
ncbi:hypothetical protein WBG99_05705 [Streptomyces sp. TG1A-60]|uniref:hypothetical protein n=1 Tax=Streptomyces sp. TG1A-60 TaxID=3129111 RepID=UPI0030CEFFB7